MKRLTIMNRLFGFLIGSILAAILLLALPIGCKSVHKSQIEKTESATVKKSDSSSSKSYSYVDATKTDSSTEITTTTITIDSVEYDYIPKGDLGSVVAIPNEPWISLPNGDLGKIEIIDSKPWPTGPYIEIKAPTGKAKAKGIKITTTTIKQAATKAKGVTIKEDTKQTDINTDSTGAKAEKSKEVVKEPSIKMGIGLVFGIALVIGLIWLVIWVWRKKKAVIGL